MVVLLLGFDVKMGWGSACDILRRSRDCVIVLSLVLLGLRTEWSVCIGRECHSVLGGRRFQCLLLAFWRCLSNCAASSMHLFTSSSTSVLLMSWHFACVGMEG